VVCSWLAPEILCDERDLAWETARESSTRWPGGPGVALQGYHVVAEGVFDTVVDEVTLEGVCCGVRVDIEVRCEQVYHVWKFEAGV
jgi:hypothetical protein